MRDGKDGVRRIETEESQTLPSPVYGSPGGGGNSFSSRK